MLFIIILSPKGKIRKVVTSVYKEQSEWYDEYDMRPGQHLKMKIIKQKGEYLNIKDDK